MRYGTHLACVVLVLFVISAEPASARSLEITTSEVSAPDVAVSPDGKQLAYTMLGHLFLLPVEGGAAEQLTFGPHYHSDPEFSPDGSQIAFVSDRDGSEGNIFILKLANREVRPITREDEAGRPVWSPDGQSVLYLSFVRRPGVPPRSAAVKRVSTSGGEPETIVPGEREIRSVFITSDGHTAYSVIEKGDAFPGTTTQIEVIDPQGSISRADKIAGYADRVLTNSKGDGVYAYRYLPEPTFGPITEDLILVTSKGKETQIIPVANDSRSKPRFGVSADNLYLYLGHARKLWSVSLPAGIRKPIPFTARVKMEVSDITAPALQTKKISPMIARPVLSPDQKTLVYQAAGYLWRQSLRDGKAERILTGNALEGSPAFSPQGNLAFVRRRRGQNEILVLDRTGSPPRTVYSGPNGLSQISWSGDELIFVESETFEGTVTRLNVAGGEKKSLMPVGFWSPNPQLSRDRRSLYFSDNRTGVGQLYRMDLENRNEKPVAVTDLERHLSNARISPDEKWVAFQRNKEIWVGSLGADVLKEQYVRKFSEDGGDSFSFTLDSKELIYSVGGQVWRQSMTTGEKTEIRINLAAEPITSPPLLIRNVRILDFDSAGFTGETSLLVRNGEIHRIGPHTEMDLPPDVIDLDAAGRFMIPGLVDMHVHATWFDPESFLAYGITSVRDTGGWLADLKMLRDRGEWTAEPVPRYFFGGEIFEGSQPYWGDSFLQIHDDQDARKYVQRFREWGADFIKVYSTLSWHLQTVVAEEARKAGMAVVGHGIYLDEMIRGASQGYRTLEHGPVRNRAGEDILKLLAETGTYWDPTLTVDGGAAVLLRDEPERLQDDKFRRFVPQSYVDMAQTSSYLKPVSDHELRGAWVNELASVFDAYEAGVKLLAGTDAPNPECFFGPSLHWELEHFAEAGLAPFEVLRIATQGAAEALGIDRLGTITPGNFADLVLLDKNPLEDIRNTQTTWRVIRGGHLYDPNTFLEQ